MPAPEMLLTVSTTEPEKLMLFSPKEELEYDRACRELNNGRVSSPSSPLPSPPSKSMISPPLPLCPSPRPPPNEDPSLSLSFSARKSVVGHLMAGKIARHYIGVLIHYWYVHMPRNNEFNCSNALSHSPEAAMPPVSELKSVAMSPTASALLALLSTCPIPVDISAGISLARSVGRPHSLIVMAFAYRMMFRNDFSSIFSSPLLQSILTIFYSRRGGEKQRTKRKTKKSNSLLHPLSFFDSLSVLNHQNHQLGTFSMSNGSFNAKRERKSKSYE